MDELFGLEIRRARRERGLSQEELGYRVGIHQSYVSQLERGLKSPTLGVLVDIAHNLGLSAGSMISAVELAMGRRPRAADPEN